jgi:hypothetical protein
MFFALIGILFFLVILLIAIKFGLSKNKVEEIQEDRTIIHTSGIYSIVRKSPREDIAKIKPSEKKINQYLRDQTVNIPDLTITEEQRQKLTRQWNDALEGSLSEIEEGDKTGIEFYYYDFTGKDEICDTFVHKGDYVTRQDIFHHPELIPPFHLGCKCILRCSVTTENNVEKYEMKYLLQKGKLPALPEWKLTLH